MSTMPAGYQNEWVKRRREQWIAEHGPCAKCGGWEQLQVDHIDPATKLYGIGNIWGRRAEIREAELAKCQVLCHRCHAKKTTAERGGRHLVHGTLTGYSKYDCRCDRCRAVATAYAREYRKDHQAAINANQRDRRRRAACVIA